MLAELAKVASPEFCGHVKKMLDDWSNEVEERIVTKMNETLAKVLHKQREGQQSADKEKNIAFLVFYVLAVIFSLGDYLFFNKWPTGDFWCTLTVSVRVCAQRDRVVGSRWFACTGHGARRRAAC